jgi:circadian clock protein KaiC
LPKATTGILALDEITGGGLPAGCPTLVCGTAGAGKTMLAVESSFAGPPNSASRACLCYLRRIRRSLPPSPLAGLLSRQTGSAEKAQARSHLHRARSEIEETGEYDLEGSVIRLGHAIDSIGAKRVVLDTLETLFAGLPNHAILRAELRRLFRWLKDRGMTAIITDERGEHSLTRYGLEEYVAECVTLLDHRVTEQILSYTKHCPPIQSHILCVAERVSSNVRKCRLHVYF